MVARYIASRSALSHQETGCDVRYFLRMAGIGIRGVPAPRAARAD
jgi:hypothetical protein